MVQKVAGKFEFETGLRHSMTEKLSPLCQPCNKWVPYSNQGMIRQRNERDGHALYYLSPRYSGTPIPLLLPRLLGYGIFLLP